MRSRPPSGSDMRSDDELARTRALAQALIAQWWALAPDAEIALEFTPHEAH
jgi:hypothetical protein